MRISAGLRWTLLALAGLAVAVAIGIAAGKLTSQRIGLASEPLDVGQSLAPRPAGQRGDGGRPDGRGGDGERRTTTTQPPTVTTTPSTTTTTPPVTTTATDDSSGGEGGDGDDD